MPQAEASPRPRRWRRVSWREATGILGCSRDTVKRRARETVETLFGARGDLDTYLRVMLEGDGVEFTIGGRWVRLRRPTARYAVWVGETA